MAFRAASGTCKGPVAQKDIRRAARGSGLSKHQVQDGDRVRTLLGDVAGEETRVRESLHSSFIRSFREYPLGTRESKSHARPGGDSEQDSELQVWGGDGQGTS